MNLEHKIEATLLFKNEPVTVSELSKSLDESPEKIRSAISALQAFYTHRGMVIVTDGEKITLGTNPELSILIEKLQKEEFSRDLGRAGLETLAIVLYKGPVSRREIDYIRGVNSGFIVRNLLVRGLIEKATGETGERSFSYKPTLELFRFLGVQKKEDLPEFSLGFEKLEAFARSEKEEEKDPA
ncbi:MAG: scpB [Parcubacteria group bacterium]|nr:scpB [Parcubacteria group bacterium]